MKTSDFYYDLPKELIAQTPAPVRSQSRLLIYNRGDGSITDGVFTDVLQHLHPGPEPVGGGYLGVPLQARQKGQGGHGL